MTTANEFSKSVDMGLRLSQRIYYGKDHAPKPNIMTKSRTLQSQSSTSSTSSFRLSDNKHHPTAPMVYAMISDPDVVDNPDIRSYQPHVYGRCNPPALIPLYMHRISMNVDCFLDTAFVEVAGAWRVHCVTASTCCDCRIAIPMGEKGSLLDINVETTKRSYFTKLITPPNDEKDSDRVTKAKDGFMMKRNTYTLKIPQVEGGSIIHVKVRWSQKLLYEGDEFCLNVPFTFPSYVLPVDKTITKIEKVSLNVNSGTETMITCGFASHPLKVQQQAGEASFLYEAEVLKWSTQDFYFAYSVCSNEIIGGLLLQRPSLYDSDQRDMFCFYLFPGTNKDNKVYKKEMIFLLDISGSMRDAPLEQSKYAITASLSKLNHGDLFNIIAFNGDIQSFSSSLELATEETITNATEWMWDNLVAKGGTNLMSPLKQAIDMVGKTSESVPLIFLITDGTVEDERDICNMIKCSLVDGRMNSPRIYTFGIGSYCNYYFLQMLAYLGRGYYDAAQDVDSVGDRMQRLLDNALSRMLANVTLDALENLESYELYPSRIPDLLSGSPLIVSGRYQGKFPEFVKARGLRADLSTYVIDVKVRKITDTHLERVCARMEVDILTAHAWLDQNTHMEKKIAKMSLQRGVPSEYTCMILVQNSKVKRTLKSLLLDEKRSKPMNQKTICLRNISVGFGNLKATTENLPPGIEDVKLNEAVKMVMKAATSCYGFMASWGCWRCLLQTWSQVKNDQCALAIAQLCTALACLEFLDCCCDLCDSCIDLCQ
ncbi:putative von Willebrand factor, type A, von Willebrand factor A-like domain superfamily [Helianthus debilis subsp. tardiflorus]